MTRRYLHIDNLIAKAALPQFNVGSYQIVSQNPDILLPKARNLIVARMLPQFLAIWKDIERATGHRWKCTSYLRDSPSHKVGHSFDLAPDIADAAKQGYAVYNNSDPVLYKREPLIKALQTLKHNDYSGDHSNDLGIFIEPDHLHIQALEYDPQRGYRVPVVKWQIPKDVYPDSRRRMRMGVVR